MSTTITLDRALSSTSKLGFYGQGLPPQTVSISEKETPEWQAGCMRFMVNEARTHSLSKVKDLKKYKMLSDQYDYSDNKWSMDPLNLGADKEELYGATDPIQHYPIVNTPLNTILGERIGRQTQYYCISQAPESRNEYYRQKGDMLFDQVQGEIMNNVMGKIIQEAKENGQELTEEFMQQAQQQAQQTQPASIQDYMDKDYVDTIESVHNRIIKGLMMDNDLETEFIEGFRHGTICGKEFYSFDVVNHNLIIKNLSPFSVFYHKSTSARWVSEGQFGGYRVFLTPSSLIDINRENLTIEDIDRLEKKMNPSGRSGGINSITGIKSISYDTSVFADWHGNTFDNINTDIVNTMIDEFQLTGRSTYNRSAFGLFEMVKAYWKSYRKVGILEVPLPDGEFAETLVDENYEEDKNAGEYIKWYYLNQVYQGTCIADDFITDVGPYPFQIFDEQNPDYSPLPIEGSEYNNYNGETMALMDLMMPWAELYDIVASELKKDLKKSIGKVMFMSIDHIPNIPGFDMNKWMYWCKEFGIAWVGTAKNKSSFSHFSAQDMSFADQINTKMILLEKIKTNCDAFGGFSQPRVAATHTAPTQGQDQQRLEASANQTEYFFWKHGKICEKVLTQGLNIKKALMGRKKNYQMLYDDLEQRYIDVDIDKQIAARVNLFVVNGTKEALKREALRQMAMNTAAKTGKPEDMADIILADTQNEIRKVLKSIRRQTDAQVQAQQQMEQQKLEAQQKIEADRLAWDREKLYATLDSEERRTYMQTFSRQEDNLKDTDANQVPDILEHEKNFETMTDNMRKHQRESRKLDIEEKTKNKELSIKNKQLDVELKNQKNDLDIAKVNAKNRNKSK